jgi:hypothetical protein
MSIDTDLTEKLDPGIKDTVLWMRDNGFKTTDSGDGVSKLNSEDTYALDYAHVFSIVEDATQLCSEVDRLGDLAKGKGYEDWVVEGNYAPGGPAIIVFAKFEGDPAV